MMRSSKICQRILFDERYREGEEEILELPDEDVHGGKTIGGGGNGGGD